MNRTKSLFTVASLAILYLGCSEDKNLNWSEYSEWMSENKELLIKQKQVNSIDISCFYQPAQYLAYNDLLKSGKIIDSVSLTEASAHYACGLTFRITVRSGDRNINLLYAGVNSETDYKKRINELNFHADEFIALTLNGQEHIPSLVSYEGYNELSNQLLFTAVFTPKAYGCGSNGNTIESVKLTFDDPYWGIGTTHFTYDNKILTGIPSLVLE